MATEPRQPTTRWEQMKRNRAILPKMRKLREQGFTHAAIAARFGLSRSRVQAMLSSEGGK